MINFFIFSQLKKPITIEDNKKQNERTIYKPPESLESLMRTQMSSKLGSFLYDSEANEEQKSKDINEPNPSTSEAQLNDLLLLSSTRTFRHCLGDSQSCGLAKELYFSLLQWLSVEANYYQQLGKGMVATESRKCPEKPRGANESCAHALRTALAPQFEVPGAAVSFVCTRPAAVPQESQHFRCKLQTNN